eukprot:scaffold54135_cov48-Phaeocystis_antarctica.AAC.1
MTDSYGDGWNGAEWDAPGFGQSFSLASGTAVQTESFVVQFQSPAPPSPPPPTPPTAPPPPTPPTPPPSPPGTFTSTASLKTAVQAVNANPASAIAMYGPVADWDVSGVSEMSGLFQNLKNFDADISSWDTSSVSDMSYMFYVRSAHAL